MSLMVFYIRKTKRIKVCDPTGMGLCSSAVNSITSKTIFATFIQSDWEVENRTSVLCPLQ